MKRLGRERPSLRKNFDGVAAGLWKFKPHQIHIKEGASVCASGNLAVYTSQHVSVRSPDFNMDGDGFMCLTAQLNSEHHVRMRARERRRANTREDSDDARFPAFRLEGVVTNVHVIDFRHRDLS